MKYSFYSFSLLSILLLSCTDLTKDEFFDLSYENNCISLGELDVLRLSAEGTVSCFGDGIVEFGHVWSSSTSNPTKEIRDGIDSTDRRSDPLFQSDSNPVAHPYTSTLTLTDDETSFFISAYAEDVHGKIIYSQPKFFLREITFNKTYWADFFNEPNTRVSGEDVVSLPDGTFIISGSFYETGSLGGLNIGGEASGTFIIKIDKIGDEELFIPPNLPISQSIRTGGANFFNSLALLYSNFGGLIVNVPSGIVQDNCIGDNIRTEFLQLNPVSGRLIKSFDDERVFNDNIPLINCKGIFGENIFGLDVPAFFCSRCVNGKAELILLDRQETFEDAVLFSEENTFYSDPQQPSLFVEAALKITPLETFVVAREGVSSASNFDISLSKMLFFVITGNSQFGGTRDFINVKLGWDEFIGSRLITADSNPTNSNESLIILADQSTIYRLIRTENNELETKQYSLPPDVYVRDAIILDDGSIVLMGDQTLIKLDANASIVWEKSFANDNNVGIFRSIDQTLSGGFIITGEKDRSLHIIRTNSLGELF